MGPNWALEEINVISVSYDYVQRNHIKIISNSLWLGAVFIFFFLNTDLKLLNADYFNHKNDTLGLSAFNLPFPMKHPCAVPQSPIQRHKPIQVQY